MKLAACILSGICYLIITVFLLWFVLSLADVLDDNNTPEPHHMKHNFFTILAEGGAEK